MVMDDKEKQAALDVMGSLSDKERFEKQAAFFEPLLPKKKRKLRIVWSCSNHHVHHEHRWKFSADLCGRVQYLLRRVLYALKLVKYYLQKTYK